MEIKAFLTEEDFQTAEEKMEMYHIVSSVHKMSKDELYEFISELTPPDRGRLYSVLQDHYAD